jgi:arabinan endo-1,5-alpha-L-arabinosidase
MSRKSRLSSAALFGSAICAAAAMVLTIASAQQAGRGPTSAPTFPPEERARMTQLGSRGVRAHDPSTIVKCKDEYWIFYTGAGVLSYHSKDMLTWERGPQIFTATPSWVAQVVPQQGRRGGRGQGAPSSGPATTPARGGRGFGGGVMSFWAPDVIHFGDRYLVYYSASAFGRNTSGIGVVTNPTLDPNDPNYKWTDQGLVVSSAPADDFNTIDPAVSQDADGNLWLAFGSFWSGIKLIQLDPATGRRIAPDSPMYSLAHYGSIEASFIYFHDGYYYLFVDWGLCCRGVRSTYNMRVGRSQKITGPYVDKDGHDMLTGGGSLLLDTDGAFIGPGHAGIIKDGDKYWMSMHFYDGTTPPSGGTLAIRPLTWTTEGWPRVE